MGLLLAARPRRRCRPDLPLSALPSRSDSRRAVVRGEERAAETSGRSAPQSDRAKRADLRSTILGFDTSRGSALRVNLSGSSGFRSSCFRASGFGTSGFRASGNRPRDLKGIHPDSSYRFDNSHHHDKGDAHRRRTHTHTRTRTAHTRAAHTRAADPRTADTDAYHPHGGCGEAQCDCGEDHGRDGEDGGGEARGRKNTRAKASGDQGADPAPHAEVAPDRLSTAPGYVRPAATLSYLLLVAGDKTARGGPRGSRREL